MGVRERASHHMNNPINMTWLLWTGDTHAGPPFAVAPH
jgi:hypothetical protein